MPWNQGGYSRDEWDSHAWMAAQLLSIEWKYMHIPFTALVTFFLLTPQSHLAGWLISVPSSPSSAHRILRAPAPHQTHSIQGGRTDKYTPKPLSASLNVHSSTAVQPGTHRVSQQRCQFSYSNHTNFLPCRPLHCAHLDSECDNPSSPLPWIMEGSASIVWSHWGDDGR